MSETCLQRVLCTLLRPPIVTVGCALALALAPLADAIAAGPWRASADNTSGWSFMTPDERIEHQRRMRGFKTYEECAVYQAQHHAYLQERAARAGVVLEQKAASPCDRLRTGRRGE